MIKVIYLLCHPNYRWLSINLLQNHSDRLELDTPACGETLPTVSSGAT